MLVYGLRRNEVLSLKWSVFDFINNTIIIKHKVVETLLDILLDRQKNNNSQITESRYFTWLGWLDSN